MRHRCRAVRLSTEGSVNLANLAQHLLRAQTRFQIAGLGQPIVR